ncbi:MAG: hypothetical protein Q4C01_02885 [Clostridia bacterium]|nr:hypothetical protein [Clostridia bacterium]
MRKIAIIDDGFMDEAKLEHIRSVANGCGFSSVDYYSNEEEMLGMEAEYEILFGSCKPSFLKKMKKLKWFCCDFAGVEPYMSDEIYPDSEVMLSNTSGAYGITISEHITMVALMLLRNMPTFQSCAQDAAGQALYRCAPCTEAP